MVWQDTHRLPWAVLILFGGGLSLAAAVSGSGLAQWLGSSLTPLGGLGIFVLVVGATALVIFLTELTSNVATATHSGANNNDITVGDSMLIVGGPAELGYLWTVTALAANTGNCNICTV